MEWNRGVFRHAGWVLLAFTAIYESVAGWIYVTGDPQNFDFIFRAKYLVYLPLVVTHGTCSIVALACGPWQFLEGLRLKWPRLHRSLGYAYLGGVLIGSLTGLAMATMEGEACLLASVLWLWRACGS